MSCSRTRGHLARAAASLAPALALVGLAGPARAQDVAAPSSSSVLGLSVDGDHDVLDEVRLGGMVRAGALERRRTSPHEGDVTVVAPTRAQLSLDAIFRQDVTVRASAAWDGTLGAVPAERARTGKEDKVVLEELFVEARNLGGSPFWARLGRQPIARGTAFLLGEDLAHSRTTHDAALLAWETPTSVLQVYWERLSRRGRPGIDGGAFTGAVDSGGAYITKRFIDEVGADLYAIHLRDRSPGSQPEDRTTLGGRVFGRAWDLVDYSFEGATQLGTKGTGDDSALILAYATEGVVSLDLRRLPLAPRFTVHGALASGDKDPRDHRATTFDPLFEDSHDRFGLSDLVVLENLRALGVRVGVRPTDSLLIEASFHSLWVDEPGDPSAPRFFAGHGRASRSRELGRELSARIHFDPRDEVSLELGGAVLVPGAYARAKLEGAAVLGSAYLQVELHF